MKLSSYPLLANPSVNAIIPIVDNESNYTYSLAATINSNASSASAVNLGFSPVLTGRSFEVTAGVWKPTKIVRKNWTTSLNRSGTITSPHGIPNIDEIINSYFMGKQTPTNAFTKLSYSFANDAPLRFLADRVNLTLGSAFNYSTTFFQTGYAVIEYFEL